MIRVFEVAEHKFHAKMKKDEGWWCVRCVEEKGAISQGRTVKSALRNIKDALTLLLLEKEWIIRDDHNRCYVWVFVDNPKLLKLLKESVRLK